ncbi:MAG: hypothetical protein DHS20C16_29150 [Phycisphaerae bacterium]|nr:MAG: hypothetical protein DHS20C16_29150 [Phycisphaerae bacterium]
MFDVQIIKALDIPARAHQSKAQVILFCLHEEFVVQPADPLVGDSPQSHAATHEDMRQGSTFAPAIG